MTPDPDARPASASRYTNCDGFTVTCTPELDVVVDARRLVADVLDLLTNGGPQSVNSVVRALRNQPPDTGMASTLRDAYRGVTMDGFLPRLVHIVMAQALVQSGHVVRLRHQRDDARLTEFDYLYRSVNATEAELIREVRDVTLAYTEVQGRYADLNRRLADISQEADEAAVRAQHEARTQEKR